MAPSEPTRVTKLQQLAGQGDPAAPGDLLPLVYDQLRRLAQAYMRQERPGQTLQATALVHEAYLKLVGGADVAWKDRGHFFAAAALAMRRILVDHARARGRDKRGGDRERVTLAEHAGAIPSGDDTATDLLALDEALAELEASNPRRYQVVMLRYFAGLSIEDTAAAMNVAPATVKTDWAVARLWLFKKMGGTPAQTAAEGP